MAAIGNSCTFLTTVLTFLVFAIDKGHFIEANENRI